MSTSENNERKRAIAAALIKKTVDSLENEAVVADWIDAYRRRVPLKEIAGETLTQYPDSFKDLSIGLLVGVIRTKIREVVSKRECEEIEFHHRSTGQRATYVSGRHNSLTAEISRKGGEKSGRLHQANQTGMFALSEHQKSSNARKGGAAAHEAIGHIPWRPANDESHGMNELDFCMYLSTQPKFCHQKGNSRCKPNNQHIAEELNRVFHGGKVVRTAKQINIRRCKEKNRLKVNKKSY